MKFEESLLVKNFPKALALAFGFEKNYPLNLPKETKKCFRVEGNSEHRCKRCGLIQESGMMDSGNILIGANSNDLYDFAEKESPFLCDYCIYNFMFYAEKGQKGAKKKGRFDRIYGDMSNLILGEEGFRHFNTLASDKNELYDLLVSPPEPPFVILIKKQKGSVFETAYYRAVATIDSRMPVIHYGREEHPVLSEAVLRCANEFLDAVEGGKLKEIAPKGAKISEDLFFNRSRSAGYNQWLTPTLRASRDFMSFYGDWMCRYDSSTRLIAKMILNRVKKERKEQGNSEE